MVLRCERAQGDEMVIRDIRSSQVALWRTVRIVRFVGFLALGFALGLAPLRWAQTSGTGTLS